MEDIERGKVSSALALEPKVRSKLEALMRPDPERAAQLRAHFQDGFCGIAKRVWPHLHLVLAVDSGSNQIYGEMLRENYCQGVPFYSPFYAATEGRNLHVNTSDPRHHGGSKPIEVAIKGFYGAWMCYCFSKWETHLWLVTLAPIVCMGPCRSNRSEPVASGAKQTLHAVSSFNVLRVPA